MSPGPEIVNCFIFMPLLICLVYDPVFCTYMVLAFSVSQPQVACLVCMGIDTLYCILWLHLMCILCPFCASIFCFF